MGSENKEQGLFRHTCEKGMRPNPAQWKLDMCKFVRICITKITQEELQLGICNLEKFRGSRAVGVQSSAKVYKKISQLSLAFSNTGGKMGLILLGYKPQTTILVLIEGFTATGEIAKSAAKTPSLTQWVVVERCPQLGPLEEFFPAF